MEITAKLVKELRDQTGAGMMDCKKVLGEADGDMEKATTLLREKGIAKAASKSDRATTEGVIATYIHQGDKLGVMVEIACETDFVARTDEFKTFSRNVAMHIAASSPVCVNREDVDSELVEKEKEIYRHQGEQEGKPANIVEKIIEGRVDKFFGEIVLMEQPFVKDPDKSVGDLVKGTIGSLGENIIIKRFSRFALGE